jgi:uncharacterized cupredoxin-like copper-binding protein
MAAGDLSRNNPIEVVLEMGTNGDTMYFKPDHLEFETGKAYKLVLRNVDDVKHEFASPELVERVFTRKVELETPGGDLIAEIKGLIHEVEVGPHTEAQWFFVPIQLVENGEMVCEIEGHEEAGMHGTITIK